MSAEHTRFLVTGVGGPAGGSLARQLVERGFSVVGVDVQPVEIAGIRTRVVPFADDPSMVPALVAIVAAEEIDVMIPTVQDELPTVAASVDGFAARVVIAEAGATLIAQDKLTTSYRLARNEVPVPSFWAPSHLPNLAAAFDSLGLPFIAKPRVSRGGRGVVVVRSEHDLAWSELTDATIFQAFAPGDEYAPVVHIDPRGIRTPVVVVLEKTGLAGGEVGNATGVIPVESPEIADLAFLTARALGLTGPVDMDIRRLADGTPVVLEVNARFGANSAAAPALLDEVLACLGLVKRVGTTSQT